MNAIFNNLLSPLQIGGIQVKNRVIMGPMGADLFNSKGEITDAAIDYFVARARGGYGLLYTGAIYPDTEVDPFVPIEGDRPLLHPASFRKSALRLNERLESYGAKMFMQLAFGIGRNHPGTLAPSRLPVWNGSGAYAEEITRDQIKRKIEAMIKCAELAKNAGFAGVDVHSLHWGYLLDEFAMSFFNHREDEYGGCLDNRLRITKECVEGIKQVCGKDFPVTMRVGLKSYITGFERSTLTGEGEVGRTLEEGIEICKKLESYGYDALIVDVGVYDSFYHAAPPAYMPKGHVIPMAAKVKAAVDHVPIICSSRMNDPDMCEAAIQDGKIDAVMLSRQAKADPDYVKKLEMGCPERILQCIACNVGCFGRSFMRGMVSSCALNPASNREAVFGLEKALQPKKVAVVGGGIAGMATARTLAQRGHSVEIYERTAVLGGNLLAAGSHDFKGDIRSLRLWYEREIAAMKIPVHFNTEVTAEMLLDLHVDTAILAVGSDVLIPPIPGVDRDNVYACTKALLDPSCVIGEKVVVVGGGLTGCEIAMDYAMHGKSVSIVEALPKLMSAGQVVPVMSGGMVIDVLNHYGVEQFTAHKLCSIEENGVYIVPSAGGEKQFIEANTVILSLGFRPRPSMKQALLGCGIEVYEIGDGLRVGNTCTAIGDAYEIARSI